ncbi:hypothetical protein WA026_007642 [Henosepilachna vigintioctopunctata]|uniref:Small ribosomal subunit protein mS23 n=1 Tax=Henosepilachna vigintioctopunctata TaxID=420089 RepID=A0AAW1U2U9_9CUCU
MAGSRLEKIGTIYSRASGLMQSGASRWEDRPLWYDLYEAFPPKEEPRYDRPAPNLKLRQIFYQEDKIRALFHKHNKNIGAVNLLQKEKKTLTQRFIDHYSIVEKKYENMEEPQKIYDEALELLKREQDTRNEIIEITSEISDGSQVGESKGEPLKINIGDIFK